MFLGRGRSGSVGSTCARGFFINRIKPMRPSEIKVNYRGGFRGPYIDVRTLIKKRVKLTVIDFQRRASNMMDVDSYTYMQLRISGKLCVTWHSSAVLMNYLEDCRAQSNEILEHTGTDPGIFPINDCIIVEGDDKGYYLEDAPHDAYEASEADIFRLSDESNRGRRWCHGRG